MLPALPFVIIAAIGVPRMTIGAGWRLPPLLAVGRGGSGRWGWPPPPGTGSSPPASCPCCARSWPPAQNTKQGHSQLRPSTSPPPHSSISGRTCRGPYSAATTSGDEGQNSGVSRRGVSAGAPRSAGAVVPVQHPKCAQRVPATGVPVAVLHREVHRAGMGVLQQPGAVGLLFRAQQGRSPRPVADPAGPRRRGNNPGPAARRSATRWETRTAARLGRPPRRCSAAGTAGGRAGTPPLAGARDGAAPIRRLPARARAAPRARRSS